MKRKINNIVCFSPNDFDGLLHTILSSLILKDITGVSELYFLRDYNFWISEESTREFKHRSILEQYLNIDNTTWISYNPNSHMDIEKNIILEYIYTDYKKHYFVKTNKIKNTIIFDSNYFKTILNEFEYDVNNLEKDYNLLKLMIKSCTFNDNQIITDIKNKDVDPIRVKQNSIGVYISFNNNVIFPKKFYQKLKKLKNNNLFIVTDNVSAIETLCNDIIDKSNSIQIFNRNIHMCCTSLDTNEFENQQNQKYFIYAAWELAKCDDFIPCETNMFSSVFIQFLRNLINKDVDYSLSFGLKYV